MELHPNIRQWCAGHQNHITTAEFVSCGLSKTMLTRYVEAGLLLRVGRGVYVLPDTKADLLYQTALRSKHIIYSHETALYLHGILAEMPEKLTITIPANASLRKELRDRCICHYAEPGVHPVGEMTRQTVDGHSVPCYNMERTVCDYIRCRNRYPDTLILEVLQAYFGQRGRNIELLAQYAALFGIAWTLEQYMEALR